MIDFVSIKYYDKDNLENFVLNPENFKEVISLMEYHSGEVLFPYKANVENIEIAITKKQGRVKNSLHKLFNILKSKKEHNHNDFRYSSICETIDYLKEKIVDVSKASITQLEFGFNIEIPAQPESVIKHNVLMHQLNGYTHEDNFDGKGYLKSFDHDEYLIKVYDKSKQFKIKGKYILRFEIKYKKNKPLHKFGIYNLEDLKDKTKLDKLFEDLMKRFEELTIADNYSERKDIPDEVKAKLDAYSSFSYWQQFNNNQTKMVHKRAYFKLLEKYNLLKVKADIKTLLEKKYQELIKS